MQVRETYQNGGKKLFNIRVPEEYEPGSMEERQADLEVRKLIAQRLWNVSQKKCDRAIYRQFNTNRDGVVTYDEFLTGMKNLDLGLSDQEVRIAR